MSVTVLTAIYGGYDELKEVPKQSVECDFLAVTDSPMESETWKIINKPLDHLHPRMAAKFPKMCPRNFTNSDIVIWVDASAQITSPMFVADMINALGNADLAQFAHPDRDCVYQEAMASIPMAKYAEHENAIVEQVAKYAQMGHPQHWGLWATGIIIWRPNMALISFGGKWFDECVRHSYQDQLSEPYLLKMLGIHPKSLPHNLRDNPWLNWQPHRSEL